MQNCEAAGNGDSGLYPGSGADHDRQAVQAVLPGVPLQPGGPLVRQPPQHRRLLRHQQPRHADHREQLLRQRARLHDRRVHGARPPGLPAARQRRREQQLLRQQLQPVRRRTPTWSRSSPRRSAPACGSPAATPTSSANNHFYDNWRRGAMLFAVPDATVCGPPPVGSDDAGARLRPARGVDVVRQPLPRQHDGRRARTARSSRTASTSGGTPSRGNTGNCWWAQHRRPGQEGDQLAALLPGCAGRHGAGDQHRHRRRRSTRPSWSPASPGSRSPATPTATTRSARGRRRHAQPGSAAALTADTAAAAGQAFAAICANGLATRLCTPFQGELAGSRQQGAPREAAPDPLAGVKPASTDGPAGQLHLQLVAQGGRGAPAGDGAADPATSRPGRVDGTKALGYGAGMSDARAAKLFEDRCSTFQAGPFALYKIYGAAAPFAALTK